MPIELVLVDRDNLLAPATRRLLEDAAGGVADGDGVLVVANVLPAQPDGIPVSRRERDVLQLLALGYTNREIAETLRISVRTVEVHRRNLQRKLRATSRADLVARAFANGYASAAVSASNSTSSSSGIE